MFLNALKANFFGLKIPLSCTIKFPNSTEKILVKANECPNSILFSIYYINVIDQYNNTLVYNDSENKDHLIFKIRKNIIIFELPDGETVEFINSSKKRLFEICK
jgi:hypothetical protein